MYVMMPVQVIGRACKMCPRLKIFVDDDLKIFVGDDYKGSQIADRNLECVNYDECLNTLNMYRKGQEEEAERNPDPGAGPAGI